MSNQIIAEASIDVNEAPRQAEQAQITANNNTTGINNINDPNKLGPAEKATLKRKHDTDVLLYSMDTKKLTDNQLSTAEIDSTMSALTAYMTPFFANMTTTDTIDRDTLNTVYKNFDIADKNADSAFTNMVSSAASDAMVAGSQASVAGSEAVVAGNNASSAASSAAVQASVAVSNANAANSNATSGIEVAQSAANDMAVVSEAVTALKGGSTLTLEQLENGLRTKITAGDLSIGGTNLLRDTGFNEDGHPHWKGPADFGVTDGYLNHNAVSFDGTSLTGSNYIDFQQIIYDNNTKLIKLGQWHTLSFYAKGSGEFASYVYPLTIDTTAGAYVDGQFISPSQPGGNNFWTLTDDWVRHTYIFKTNASISTDANAVQQVLWRSYAGTKASICMPQLETGNVVSDYSRAPEDTQSDITQSINNIHFGFKNPNGTTFQMNLSADGTALMDFSKIMLNGATNIQDLTVTTAKLADMAVTNAKIGKLAVGTAQIADLAVTSAKVSEIDASLIKSGTVDTNRLNADAIIANVINGKTITGIVVNTPTLNLGLNGQFTESYNYTQDTSWFLPKKASGDVTFNHGVIEDQGTMQSYVNGTWGAINDSSVFTSGMTNNVWTEYAPGYYKIDMYKQGSTSNVLQRTYADPTGYYYTDAAGDKSYLGNVLQTPQVQTGSLFSTTLNQMPGDLRMRVVANGSDWGLQVGSYAGSEAVLSDFIYNSTSSASANLYTTANGHIVRSTSASKYKYNVKHAIDEDSLADKLLTMHVSTWNDKHAVDSYAQTLTDNTKSEDISIKDNYGLIAEDLRDAGLDMFVEYGNNHTIEGIEYDRAWLPLLPKMRQMNDKINEYELRISKLEAEK